MKSVKIILLLLNFVSSSVTKESLLSIEYPDESYETKENIFQSEYIEYQDENSNITTTLAPDNEGIIEFTSKDFIQSQHTPTFTYTDWFSKERFFFHQTPLFYEIVNSFNGTSLKNWILQICRRAYGEKSDFKRSLMLVARDLEIPATAQQQNPATCLA